MGIDGLTDRYDKVRKIACKSDPLTVKELQYKCAFIFFCRVSVFLLGILFFVVNWAHSGYTHVNAWALLATLLLSWWVAEVAVL